MATQKKYNRTVLRKFSDRTYGKLEYKNSTLGVFLQDKQEGSFFIYADKLVKMWINEDQYTTIKARTRDPKKLGGFCDGEICGYIDIFKDDVEICIFYGHDDGDLYYDNPTATFIGYKKMKAFIMPQSEFEVFINAIELMNQLELGKPDPVDQRSGSYSRN